MEIIGPLLIATIAGLSTVLGGLVVLFNIKKENINKFITFCLSFSLAIMILISITDLIPNSTYIILEKYGTLEGMLIIAITFIIGVFMINIINKKIKNYATKETTDSNLYRVGILSMVALMIHNLPEGIATFMSAYKDINLGITLGIAIMLHNIPEGISIAVPLYYSTGKKKSAIFKTFISGLAEPIGAILAFIFLSHFITDVLISVTLILVAGIMITLAINELFPKAKEYNQDKYIIFGLISGLVIMIVNHLIF